MPNYHPTEWPLEMCKAKEAWELPLPIHGLGKSKGEDIIIVHPDTGYTNHPELLKGDKYLTSLPDARNFFGRFSKFFTAEDNLSGDSPSHGTTTASLMFSDEDHPSLNPPNNNYPNYTVPVHLYVTGIAPKAKVLPLRVTDFVMLHSMRSDYGQPVNTYVTVANALFHAISLNNPQIGVVSISLGGLRTQSNLNSALLECRRQGIIVCAAAGQIPGMPEKIASKKDPIFPGNSPHTIGVAGSTQSYERPPEAFYGNVVDITTPGWGVIVARTSGEVPSNFLPNPVRNFNIDLNSDGTSYSTAITAGACALWLAYHNRNKLIQTFGKPFLFDLFRHCLIGSCDNRSGSWPRDRGLGVLNVEALLNFPLPSVASAESIARSNNWNESNWGDSSNWGRL